MISVYPLFYYSDISYKRFWVEYEKESIALPNLYQHTFFAYALLIFMKQGRLTFVGLGLYDEQDMSLKAFNTLRSCDHIFSEFYTSTMMGTTIDKLGEIIEKPIKVLSREETEEGSKIITKAKTCHVCFLTGGDAMTATTHVDLRLRAIKEGILTKVIHGTSIVTSAPGLLGLQQYKFGRTTTLVLPEDRFFPTSPYDVIKDNKKQGLHTLILLDIQSDKDRFMTATEGLQVLLEMEQLRQENIISNDDLMCVVCQAGSEIPRVFADTIKALSNKDFGPPLHTLVLPGNLHFMEIEALQTLAYLPEYLGKKLQKL